MLGNFTKNLNSVKNKGKRDIMKKKNNNNKK